MHRSLKAAIAIALTSIHFTACKGDESTPLVLLVVETAQQQPATDGLGIIVLVQASGGKWLEVETRGATLPDGRTKACLLAPQATPLSQSLTTLLLLPKQDEAVITVRLLPDGPQASQQETNPATVVNGDPSQAGPVTSAGTSTVAASAIRPGPCGIDSPPLREVTKPVSRKPVQPPLSSTGGTSGTGGSIAIAGSAASMTSLAGSNTGASNTGASSAGGSLGTALTSAGNSSGGTRATGGAQASSGGASSGGGSPGVGGTIAGSAGMLSIAGGVS